MSIKATSDLWWKNAVFYCLDVEMFYDLDGDGCGDLPGLTERVDYLAGLGVSCVWLMPFYPSPNRDDGYDIVDFYARRPAPRDARRLRRAGPHLPRPRHPRDRRLRDEPHLRPAPVVPGGALGPATRRTATSTSGATRSPRRSPATSSSPTRRTPTGPTTARPRQYYLHSFYSHQPDLNLANPEVRDELAQVMGFWLAAGPVRLPRGRRAVPDRGRDGRPAPAPARPARLPQPPQRRGGAARRGQPAAEGRARVPRRRGRRRAAHGARLHRQPGAVPGARARRGRAAGAGAARLPADPADARRSGASCATTTSSRSTS